MARRRSPILLWASVAVSAIIAFAVVSAFFAYRFTSRSSRPAGSFAEWLPPTTETIHFTTRDGVRLAGWLVPPPTATHRAVVLLHGNGSNRRQVLARAALFHREGFTVLLYDARGHGESAGDRVSIGWFERNDLTAALDFLRAHGATELGVVGVSQGAATIALAAREFGPDVRWAVLESMYPSLRDAVDCRFRRVFAVPGWLGGLLMVPFAEWRLGVSIDDIAPLERISALTCPVLIMHGDLDSHTRVESAHALFARAASPKQLWIVKGAGHNDLYGFAKTEYEHHVIDFVRSTQSSAPAAAP